MKEQNKEPKPLSRSQQKRIKKAEEKAKKKGKIVEVESGEIPTELKKLIDNSPGLQGLPIHFCQPK